MKKYITAGLSLLLVLLFTAALFSACGKKAQETAAQATTEEEKDDETTTGDITAEKETKESSSKEATDDELSVLGRSFNARSLLNACTDTFFVNEDPSYMAEFTGNMTAAEIKNALFLGSRSPLYEFYFDKPDTVTYSAGLNPLDADAARERTYVVYDEKKTDAMLQKMLGLKNVTAKAMAEAEGGSTKFYCKDGKLYLEETARVSSHAPYAAVEEVSRLRDGKYRISVQYALFENEEMISLEGQGELIAGIVVAAGERHWAVYSYSAFLRRTQPQEETTGEDESAAGTASATYTAADAYLLLGESADEAVKAYGNNYKEKTSSSIVYETPGVRLRLNGGKVSAVTLWGETAVYDNLRANMTAKELQAVDSSVEIEEYDDAAEATVSIDGYVFLYTWEKYNGVNDAAARVTISKE